MTKQDSLTTSQDNAPSVLGRRRFMNTAALAGLATVVACTDKGTPSAGASAQAAGDLAHGQAAVELEA